MHPFSQIPAWLRHLPPLTSHRQSLVIIYTRLFPSLCSLHSPPCSRPSGLRKLPSRPGGIESYIYHAERTAECTGLGGRLIDAIACCSFAETCEVFLACGQVRRKLYTTESRFRIEDLTYIEDFDYYSLHLSRCLAMF